MSTSAHQLEFVTVEHATCNLGWRFDDALPPDVMDTLASFTNDADFRTLFFSPSRTVEVPRFAIATTTISWEDLCQRDDEELDEIDSLDKFCQRLESDLRQFGWRLPLEDEFELACGGELFPWGNEMPEGIPYGDMTAFTGHKTPNERGLYLNSNTYRVELAHNQLKLGDGGESVCGGYPWPIPWLSFCPAYRISADVLEECLFEMLEDAQVRPVLL